MKAVRKCGFTLIELLTVIAIISILAGLTAVALPRALEKAKITDAQADMNAIRTALVQYYTENGSYPLAYGFRTWFSREMEMAGPPYDPGENPFTTSDENMYCFTPYMAQIDLYEATDFYDRFAMSNDSDSDDFISRLEFSPILDESTSDHPWTAAIYNPPSEEYECEGPERPYIYAPVNLSTFRRLVSAIKKSSSSDPAIEEEGGMKVWNGRAWPQNADIELVTPKYDAFVLISCGPAGTTAGLAGMGEAGEQAFRSSLVANNDEAEASDVYQALALRTYYLATRDANDNNLPDYDFIARTREREASENSWSTAPFFRILPDGTNGAGPLIFAQEG